MVIEEITYMIQKKTNQTCNQIDSRTVYPQPAAKPNVYKYFVALG